MVKALIFLINWGWGWAWGWAWAWGWVITVLLRYCYLVIGLIFIPHLSFLDPFYFNIDAANNLGFILREQIQIILRLFLYKNIVNLNKRSSNKIFTPLRMYKYHKWVVIIRFFKLELFNPFVLHINSRHAFSS